jgi:hypothetical protein
MNGAKETDGKARKKKPRYKWVGNFEVDLRERIGWYELDWDWWRALVNTEMNL